MRSLNTAELGTVAGGIGGPPPLWDYVLDGVWPPPMTPVQLGVGLAKVVVTLAVVDIGNSLKTTLDNGGTVGGFIQETAGNYGYYCNPFNWP